MHFFVDMLNQFLSKLFAFLPPLKMLELNHRIEKSKTTLKSLQDLDSNIRRFEAAEKIEDVLTGLRVIE